jgi:prepilin-type N-terminal cleavage/methylation domain-containing protein
MFYRNIRQRFILPARSGNPQNPGESREAGFTLAEVLVALAVLALSWGLLLQQMGHGLRRTDVAGRAGEATALAQSLLARVGADLPLRLGTRQARVCVDWLTGSAQLKPTCQLSQCIGSRR